MKLYNIILLFYFSIIYNKNFDTDILTKEEEEMKELYKKYEKIIVSWNHYHPSWTIKKIKEREFYFAFLKIPVCGFFCKKIIFCRHSISCPSRCYQCNHLEVLKMLYKKKDLFINYLQKSGKEESEIRYWKYILR